MFFRLSREIDKIAWRLPIINARRQFKTPACSPPIISLLESHIPRGTANQLESSLHLPRLHAGSAVSNSFSAAADWENLKRRPGLGTAVRDSRPPIPARKLHGVMWPRPHITNVGRSLFCVPSAIENPTPPEHDVQTGAAVCPWPLSATAGK